MGADRPEAFTTQPGLDVQGGAAESGSKEEASRAACTPEGSEGQEARAGLVQPEERMKGQALKG